ncbi:MAG: sigma-54 dependent transcriptional regulator [Bacteroidales bacterium]|jgi:transcriptional regulator with PAS, ATPase and Fis domain|nr:sigma-54 dependent transcriptional regulator [Bacteroidales bacterium]
MTDLVALKQRYGIIGHSVALDYAMHVAVEVAPTDLSVLILGESGVGKENIAHIIHDFSAFKHGPYITVNCGAIPEGTIDSELFGHEKGAFTGATDHRKGYFEVAHNGTIFLDEVADLPLSTQVRLLRVLETGDFIKVGSSKVQKCSVRVVAATNVNITERVASGRFRPDLYYRLNTIPIAVPPLRDRDNDVVLLFTKFAGDFAVKYRFPRLELSPEATRELKEYSWPGNVRQLKNITEQMSLIEKERTISAETLQRYLKAGTISCLPVPRTIDKEQPEFWSRDMVFGLLNQMSDMKAEIEKLKIMVRDLSSKSTPAIPAVSLPEVPVRASLPPRTDYVVPRGYEKKETVVQPVIEDDDCSLSAREKELIQKALLKHGNHRKAAAEELGISERTLYRKIKDYGL